MLVQNEKQWFKAKLAPPARGLFTASFYPTPKKRTGTQYVYFAEAENNIAHKKVILASAFDTSSLRIVTHSLAEKCLIPCAKASKAEMKILNELSQKMKV